MDPAEGDEVGCTLTIHTIDDNLLSDCGYPPGVPEDWPPGHHFETYRRPDAITCPTCKEKAIKRLAKERAEARSALV